MPDLELHQKALVTLEGLTLSQLDERIKARGIDFKYPKQLDEAIAGYEGKIPIIKRDLLRIAIAKQNPELFPEVPVVMEQVDILRLARLLDKLACCLKEKELRASGDVKRKLHGTLYYIDLDAGNDGNTGLSTAQSWLTIEQYTTTTVRTAGDIAWVRANTSEIPAVSIVCDEDGNKNNLIEIRGCSSVAGEDPWGDASDVKPIIDYNATSKSFYIAADNYWRLYRLDFTGSTVNSSGQGALTINEGIGCILESLDIHGNGFTGLGVMAWAGFLTLIDLNFYDNTSKSLHLYETGYNITAERCVFNGGVGGTAYAIRIDTCPVAHIKDSTFGSTTQHATATFYSGTRECKIFTRNCKLDDANLGSGYPTVHNEDSDQVKGDNISLIYSGLATFGYVQRNAAVQLDGLDSALMTPASNCGLYQPLLLNQNRFSGAYRIWCAAALTTITIKARETVAWAADPAATEFYFEASYLSAAIAPTRSTVASAQGLNGINEVNFTMTFTPLQAGWVYVNAYLKDYEAGKTINVSVKPAVS